MVKHMTKTIETITIRSKSATHTVDAEKIGPLFVHQSVDFDGRYYVVSAPNSFALGWFKNVTTARRIAKTMVVEFPAANWQATDPNAVFASAEDFRRAFDIVRPHRVV